jgi:3-deoxy-D-manno-octulosonic-acid transferase
LFVIILSLPVTILLLIFNVKSFRKGISERLTIYSPGFKKELKEKEVKIWVHASSVGEVKLLDKIPGFPVNNAVVTCSTVTGREMAKKMFPEITALLMPLDFIFLWKRLKKLLNAQKIIIIETELWPGFLHAASDIQISLVNARLSDKSFPFYYRLRKFFIKLLLMINKIYVRDEENYERFKKMGVPAEGLELLGNLKYYYKIPEIKDSMVYGTYTHPILVCGSTHKGEEKILMDLYLDLKKEFNDMSIIISPRHLDRLREVEDYLKSINIEYNKWSNKNDQIKPGEVLIVDVMGELPKIYSLGTVSFIGGSLVPVGGHNIIEAAVWCRPVVTGPYNHNFRDIVSVFHEEGGLKVADSEKDLYNILVDLFRNPETGKALADKNINVFKLKKKEIEERLINLL